MFSVSSVCTQVLINKGIRNVAADIHAECSNLAHEGGCPPSLANMLDEILNPSTKAIDDRETINWCKWLIAGGNTPEDFAKTVTMYDSATTCGLVWTPNFVAYRCRTCGISPCMSLCTECFKKGNHYGHDFNMFLSQAGGACDCGDASVMKESGFCDRHGPKAAVDKSAAPSNLMCVAEAMMPRIILRLIQYLRENCAVGPRNYGTIIQDADEYLTMLIDFNKMGALMRHVMTSALTSPQKYQNLMDPYPTGEPGYDSYCQDSNEIYQNAVWRLRNPEPPDEYKECASLQEHLEHTTFLEELMFWTVVYQFPQKLVCLLLNMLPDPEYKEALTRAFVLHYSRVSRMLEGSTDPDTLSNKVVHVSVQLFSNQSLALKMVDELKLLHVMVIALKYMMSKILIQNTLHDPDKNFHYVVDCERQVMKEHCYWPIVSDLNNVLSHKPIAVRFMSDSTLLEMWFDFLSMFQGMNVNQRELNQHVQYESNTYYAAFSAELEASAYPMWALVSHLHGPESVHLTRKVLSLCLTALQDWLDAINFTHSNVSDSFQVSFHLPLHRYFAVFMCQAIRQQGATLNDLLPPTDMLHLLMMHPLRVQVAFYEILNGLWIRNGLQIKGQIMTYIQCNFCNSMVDADLYLLQICATKLQPDVFLQTIIEKFQIKQEMSLRLYRASQNEYMDGEHDTLMLESFLTFLAILVNVRTNLGLSDPEMSRLEMVTLLSMGDKTHSQLMELMPERCGSTQNRDFESVLADVAVYRAPNLEASGNMQQGMYGPKPRLVWEELFDPLHVLLRAAQKGEFQMAMDRFTQYVKQSGRLKSSAIPWPPFRHPAPVASAYDDPRNVLRSRVFHAMILIILYKAVYGHNISEHIMSLTIYLLEMAVVTAELPDKSMNPLCQYTSERPARVIKDMDLAGWYITDNLSDNLRTVIPEVLFAQEPESSGSDSEFEWEIQGELAEVGSSLMINDATDENSLEVLALPSLETISNDTGLQIAMNASLPALPQPNDISTQPALLPAPQRPAVMAGNEIVVAPSVYSRLSNSRVTSTEIVPSTSSSHKNFKRREAQGGSQIVKVDESIITLLLKLHSKLSGVPDSYNPDQDGMSDNEASSSSTTEPSESRIGDGPFFVAQLLNKIANLDPMCKEAIKDARNKLWPSMQKSEDKQREKEDREREERRRRAKERQQKLMAEFANKRKQFMEKAMETDEAGVSGMAWEQKDDATKLTSKKEYDCVICSQSSPSTEDNPIGLVVLVQETSVIGHERQQPDRVVLPTSDDDPLIPKSDTRGAYFDRRMNAMNRHFDRVSLLLSVNIGWESGVYVQTCGHHLHLECLLPYVKSLGHQQRDLSLSADSGEYLCPLCRQLANCFLPLSPKLGKRGTIVRSPYAPLSTIIPDINNLLKEILKIKFPRRTFLSEAMRQAVQDMTRCAYLKIRQQNCRFVNITSIARTNFEIELVQRGGSLCIPPPTTIPLRPKRDCTVALLDVLAWNARLCMFWPAQHTWQQLSGLPLEPAVPLALTADGREVPLLLRDPTALLLQFILLLPLHLDHTYFNSVVKVIFNLLYYQVIVQISCGFSEAERNSFLRRECSRDSEHEPVTSETILCRIIEYFNDSPLYPGYVLYDASTSSCTPYARDKMHSIEQQIQSMCLPFLRIAALLRYHLYEEPLPIIRSSQAEFPRLVCYLELVTDWKIFNSAIALNWQDNETSVAVPRMWCDQFLGFVSQNDAGRYLIMEQHISWQVPKLLSLPREYEKIFTYYHGRQCRQGHSIPQEISICLLCGAIVCLKQTRKQWNVCEVVQHSIDCGGGTGIYLVVTSTYIVVIRGQRVCLWGSLYLDDFEEEDKDLKRGKPLYLNQDRYQLLEQQWLAHRFDHTKKTWVWHRDIL